MNKKSFIEAWAKEKDISKLHAEEEVNDFINFLERKIKEEKKITFSNFGIWKVVERKERVLRDPNTKELKVIPPKKTVKFKPSPKLKEKLN